MFLYKLLLLLCLFTNYVLSDILVYRKGTDQIYDEFHDLPARFGGIIPSEGLVVYAADANPSNGCAEIQPPPEINDNRLIQWVVLIARFNCSFEQKIRNAQKAKYQAVIVYNVGSNDLESMSAENSEGITIPSVFVGERTGKTIIANFLNGTEYVLMMNDALPFNINTHLILPFSIVVGLCFILMIGFMVVRCVREHRRQRRHRLPKNQLKKIPIKKFNKGMPYETCAICLDDYIEGEKLRVLPCAHAYHSKCIDPWLTKSRNVCPVCKRKVARGEKRSRRRRSSSDSGTDSDADDTTPLLNPVENASNHGTFGDNQQPTSRYPPIGERVNPFDRVLPSTVTIVDPQTGYWFRIRQFFQSRFQRDFQDMEVNATPSTTPHDDGQTVSLNIEDRHQGSSNNLMNSNLSGSFRDDNTMSDEELLPANVPNPTTRTINSNNRKMPPLVNIDSNTQSSMPVAAASSSRNSSEPETSSQGRLGVVAIPNANFNPSLDNPAGNGRGSNRKKSTRNSTFLV